MLRIDATEAGAIRTISLSGKLMAGWVAEVRSAVAGNAAVQRTQLNLSDLRYADEAGVELLRALRRDGIEIVGWNPYTRALLGP